MSESILTSTKKVLGLAEDYTAFDPDITLFINGVFSTLTQLGIGPEGGFSIVDKTTTWDAFYGTNKNYNAVRTYMYLRVRYLFDPPQTSYLVAALKEQIQEHEWRLNTYRESYAWQDPDPDIDVDALTILDGGSP